MHYLTKIDPSRNRRRYYIVTVQATLLGAWCLVRMHASPPAAQLALERLVARKKRRGYVANDIVGKTEL